MWTCKVALTVAISVLAMLIAITAWMDLRHTFPSGCAMTTMYPDYIPIPFRGEESNAGYQLYLYHENVTKRPNLKSLRGVPVLFIPGSGGSYKQVRSIAVESEKAFKEGPLDEELSGFGLPSSYRNKLEWFTVDLKDEPSAFDSQILLAHTDFVVKSIHRILDQYKEYRDARENGGAASSRNLPTSVILVGHSVGGFVARAAVIHPHLRKSTVATIITLSSPHQSPPLPLQPSMGYLYYRINEEWRKGYENVTTQAGLYVADPLLSRVVVISISGGSSDYQVRSRIQSLDGIIPTTHGFIIGSKGMKNVWLSMEHTTIMWCNQLVKQVSHTLLSLVDPKTGQPFDATQKRLTVFTKMFRSGVAQSSDWATPSQLSSVFTLISTKDAKDVAGSGEPPPAISVGVGEFFVPKNGEREFSPLSMLLSFFSEEEVFLKEGHPRALNLSFGMGLGLLPVSLSLNTVRCLNKSRLSEPRFSPPIALAWDPTSGLHIFPNIYNGTLVVDSYPALWSHTPGTETTSVILLVDPRCSYQTSIRVSFTATASRFMLLYVFQIPGLSIAAIFFALMRQASERNHRRNVPSMLTALQYNIRLRVPLLLLIIVLPILVSFLMSQPVPPVLSFTGMSLICYAFANGLTVLLILISHLFFYLGARVHILIKARWPLWDSNRLSRTFSSRVTWIWRDNTYLMIALPVCLIHPAWGLVISLLAHVYRCHNSMCSNLNTREESIGDTQVETFHHRHGMLVLHLAATAMLVPSLIASWERIGGPYNLLRCIDSLVCIGIILAGVLGSNPWLGLPALYASAGSLSYFWGLSLAPYLIFYVMAATGYILGIVRMVEGRKGAPRRARIHID